jgi:beta-N-acetylhexosaminidase
MSRTALITGLSGTSLTPDERAFLKRVKPWGVILFARNVIDPTQIVSLVREVRGVLADRNTPIFIDQEGGRVQRLKPPIWSQYPSHAALGLIHELNPEAGLEAARLLGELIGDDLSALGIDADCDPCVDLAMPDAHSVIGDRAFSRHPGVVAALARAKRDGLHSRGVMTVMKHIPGHGRSRADSHLELPVVDTPRAELEESDFAPFRALKDTPMAMTAHVVYSAIDPEEPATTSRTMIKDVIRKAIGFDGALMSDDIGMKALGGPFNERARRAVKAGCDLVLHCSGDLTEMTAAAEGTPELTGDALRRCEAAIAGRLRKPQKFDRADASNRLLRHLDSVGQAGSYRPVNLAVA